MRELLIKIEPAIERELDMLKLKIVEAQYKTSIPKKDKLLFLI